MLYGYCRVSSSGDRQDISRQVNELKKKGVVEENLFIEHESGMKKDRVVLNRLFNITTNGDTIISLELSRITRSTSHLIELIELAKQKHLKLIMGQLVVDYSSEQIDPFSNAMLVIVGAFAQLERDVISERVKSGLSNAKNNKNIRLGRRETTIDDVPDSFYKGYELFKQNKISKVELARIANISYPTVYKYIKLLDKNKTIN